MLIIAQNVDGRLFIKMKQAGFADNIINSVLTADKQSGGMRIWRKWEMNNFYKPLTPALRNDINISIENQIRELEICEKNAFVNAIPAIVLLLCIFSLAYLFEPSLYAVSKFLNTSSIAFSANPSV